MTASADQIDPIATRDLATRVPEKEPPMVAMQAYLVSIYQSELRREAERNHLALDDTLSGQARFAGRLPGGRYPSQLPSGSGPDPRRALARVAAGLSRAAAGTARWLDPSIDDGLRRHASGAAGR